MTGPLAASIVIPSTAVAVWRSFRVNPLLAIGQIIVSIALIVAILLQARGTGLSGHVRRRLGRLPQPARRRAATLAVHDHPARPVRAVLARLVHLRRRASESRIGSVAGRDPTCRSEIHEPHRPRRHRRPRPRPRRDRGGDRRARVRARDGDAVGQRRASSPRRPTARGTIGRPVSVNPLGARTQVDRDLVALTFCGPREARAGRHARSRISRAAGRPTRPARPGRSRLRPDARWHDGEPLTAARRRLHGRGSPGSRLHGSGRRVVARGRPRRPSTREPSASTSRRRSAGSSSSRRSRSRRRTSSSGVPIEELANDPFGRAPVGSASFVVLELDDGHAILEPAAKVLAPGPDGSPPGSAGPPPDAAARRHGADEATIYRRTAAVALEFHYFDDAAALTRAFEAGDVDVASGLPPTQAADLAPDADGARALRSPGTTLTTIFLNLRLDHPELRDAGGPTCAARGARSDRDRRRASSAGMAAQADSPIPPTSWAFDRTASPPVAHDREGRRGGPHEGRLDQGRRPMAAGQGARSRTRSSCSARTPDRTRRSTRSPSASLRDWDGARASRSSSSSSIAGASLTERLRRASSARPSSTSRSGSIPTSTRCSRRARPGPAA